MISVNNVQVVDDLNVADDTSIPTLSQVLDPATVQSWLDKGKTTLATEDRSVQLRSIKVKHFKPGRRCVIEYGTNVEKSGEFFSNVTLMGKVVAKGTRSTTWKIEQELWKNGFDDKSTDGISIPEPVGRSKKLKTSFQKKIDGKEIWPLLLSPEGKYWARRVAEAAHKIHKAGIPSKRSHTIEDEIRILHERVPKVIFQNPAWRKRIESVLIASDRLAARLPKTTPRTSHRDFYQDQIIVRGDRLYILDLDLYCYADEGLDIGNFIGHVVERSLFEFNDPNALRHIESCIENHFVDLAGEHTRQAVQTYATLTLVRHIYISTLFESRQHYTENLIQLCEQRLMLTSR